MKLNKNLQDEINKQSLALKELTKIFDSGTQNKVAQKKRKDEIFFDREIKNLMAEF